MQGAKGSSGPKGDKVHFCNISFFVIKWLLIPEVMASCVLQGERGVGLAGPAGRIGPPGLKVRFRFFCDFVSHHMCHSPQTNCGLISGRSRPSWITWSSRATGETWWYWATRSERWNWTVWTSWSTRKCGWCSCWMFFYVNPAAWISHCFWFQGVQGFTGSPGKAGPPGPPGPPGQAVSLYYTVLWGQLGEMLNSVSSVTSQIMF